MCVDGRNSIERSLHSLVGGGLLGIDGLGKQRSNSENTNTRQESFHIQIMPRGVLGGYKTM